MNQRYKDFLSSYNDIIDEKERSAFFRGFTLSLTPRQAERFLQLNLKNGILALKELTVKNPNDAEEFINKSKALIEKIREKYAIGV